MLTAELIDEVRRIVRLESLRAAVFSCASESLDEHVVRLVVAIALEGDTLAATIEYQDASGSVVLGGSL